MRYALRSTLFAGALALVAVPAAAQTSANASITATAEVLGNLTIAGFDGPNFGFVVPTVTTTKTVSPTADGTLAGRFEISGSPSAEISLAWTLPTGLDLAGQPSIPLSFSTTAAAWAALVGDQTTATTFNPNVGSNLNISGAGALFVWLGGTIDATGFTGAPGTYSASVNLAIAYTGN